ncbi:unnamed protein product [Cylindrotheca closterium]|uniref:Uncharacterized protein n=1 Tax=Cylindrotheca closterium TaxID=2856 RepID=A0AAD2FJJ4_9STRA|nr:unnamed protein product [Cylindrotheca closterium]
MNQSLQGYGENHYEGFPSRSGYYNSEHFLHHQEHQLPYAASYPGVKRRRLAGASEQPYGIHYNNNYNVLLGLCQSNAWLDALQYWRAYPQAAIPSRLDQTSFMRKRGQFSAMTIRRGCWNRDGDSKGMSPFEKEETSPALYQQTVLGLICASPSIIAGDQESPARVLLKEILQYSPAQVAYSQVQCGHTPLRDAILNPHCPFDVLKMLLQADQENCHHDSEYLAASYQKDSRGLLPLDHLILRLPSDTSTRSVDMLEIFLETRPPASSTANVISKVSPLIRLLSMVDPVTHSLPLDDSAEEMRLCKIQQVVKSLLRHQPELLYVCSSGTGCSPFHIAARTCGNFLPILQELVSADASNRFMAMENIVGDLPIHVACSNGADLDVLKYVASNTASHDRQLLWRTTRFGYTPADLLWLHHIEAGSSFSKVQTFHLVHSTAENRFDKDNEYYEKVLRNEVDDAMNGSRNQDHTTMERMERAKNKFGDLLDRLFVLLSASSYSAAEPKDDGKHLHQACNVSTPYGHTLPSPLFKLILWIYKDDLLTVDENGNLPLHYAFDSNSPTLEKLSKGTNDSKKRETKETTCWNEWAEYCHDLINAAPRACAMADQRGQLPLHLLLSNNRPAGSSNCANQKLLQRLLVKAIEAFPESAQTRDPISGLDPFMLAAMGSNELPLDTIYYLLRGCPNLCHVNSDAAS